MNYLLDTVKTNKCTLDHILLKTDNWLLLILILHQVVALEEAAIGNLHLLDHLKCLAHIGNLHLPDHLKYLAHLVLKKSHAF